MNVVISAANLIQRIGNRELRDVAAYALDEVHSWRCGLIEGEGECRAVADAFVPMEKHADGWTRPTTASARLQPLSSFSAWYLAGPFVRWVQTLQHFDGDDETVRWRFDRGFLRPWRFFPGLRDEFDLVARFAASRTWYSADMFVAHYTAESVSRLKGGAGTPVFFCRDDLPTETSRACYEYSLDVLHDLAVTAYKDIVPGAMDDFLDAYAEAVRLGMLWD